MPSDAESLVRAAYDALARGDIPAMIEYVDPDLTWTFLEPTEERPEPKVCHGRRELARRAGNWSSDVGPFELEEVVSYGENIVVITHVPGLDAQRARKTGDRNFHVVTVRDGRITALRACNNRQEAIEVASVGVSPGP